MKKILIVDDEIAICSSLQFALEDFYDIYIANDSRETIDILKNNHIDFMLLDIKLGNENGLELLKKIKEINKSTVVIIMTAYASIKTTIEAIKKGAYYYLTKPIDLEELKILLKKADEFQRLHEEVKYLNEEIKQRNSLGNIIGKSPAIKKVFDLIEKVKNIDSNVLITGESGTGKELVARAIHYEGNRSKNHFVVVNCAAIPPNLLESELFGYEKGAFTGASHNKLGKFQLADKGTIFLDEIGDMDISLQAKLLHVLQNKEICPLGSNEKKKIDVRVISATNKVLEDEIEKGRFREDLYYRLNVITINIPPLRERKEDIPLLIHSFIQKYNRQFGKQVKGIERDAQEFLENYDFPGNVRELENIIERAVALSDREKIILADLPSKIVNGNHNNSNMYTEENDFIPVFIGDTLKEAEKKIIKKTLSFNNYSRKKTAQMLGISERGLRYKIKEYNLE